MFHPFCAPVLPLPCSCFPAHPGACPPPCPTALPCSFGCEEMSECPVPMPFVPLGDFIAAVGREASQEEIHTYLHRMRVSGGWWVDGKANAAANMLLVCIWQVASRFCCSTPSCCLPRCLLCFCAALALLQEKGWDVGQTIEKLLQNGARLSAEAHEIVRIPGLLTDADMIGGRPNVVLGCWVGACHPRGGHAGVRSLLLAPAAPGS